MASQARPREETRPALSRERVLEAAIALADEAGIGSLTMRKLAQELGVEAMSLYYYVAKKDEILNGIVDIVIGEIELPVTRRRLEGRASQDGDLRLRGPRPAPMGGQPRAVVLGGQPGPAAIHGVDPGHACGRPASRPR